ncbi:Uncharacterised protein [Mycobacteroides abscessus subsp. abscessus]|uniref:hypothetical protein n=1 Tax=Mycobacteroides abscessus TaxID=36809 RepID=UPI00092B4A85|nr:hypothetical protein [Mycobacteroides abscessus]SIJ22479.1 Uncharacterised protein [Mycobacteroides abscessus subsp. abscessus]SLH38275.1 Uncharacterised protein [Mycobacteroides abscessus subsp. abscessus]
MTQEASGLIVGAIKSARVSRLTTTGDTSLQLAPLNIPCANPKSIDDVAVSAAIAAARVTVQYKNQRQFRLAHMRRNHIDSLRSRGERWHLGWGQLGELLAEIDRRFDNDHNAANLAQKALDSKQDYAIAKWKPVWQAISRPGPIAQAPKFRLPFRIALQLLEVAAFLVLCSAILYVTATVGMSATDSQYVLYPSPLHELHMFFEEIHNFALNCLERVSIPKQYALWTPIVGAGGLFTISQVRRLPSYGWLTDKDWIALTATVGRFRAWDKPQTATAAQALPASDVVSELVPHVGSASAAVSTLDRKRLEHARRIAGVREALTQLDSDWLAYETDTEAFYLTKPILRDIDVPQTGAYRDALYELRELVEELGDSATDQQISRAEAAAHRALKAWDEANDYALSVGVTDRSPVEQRALRRLYSLVGQLVTLSTPEAMWPQLIDAVQAQLDKLKTVPVDWSHIAQLPALESAPRLRAIRQRIESAGSEAHQTESSS